MNIETAGSRLKKVRQEKGISLEDIAKKTKVHVNVLRAIEGDSVSNLSPVYLKGFIKIYCSSLGLDSKDYTAESRHPVKPALNATVGRPIGERVEKKPSFVKEAALKLNEIKPLINYKKIILFIVVAFVSIFLIGNLFKFFSSRGKSKLAKSRVLMQAASSKKANLKTEAEKGLSEGFSFGIFARRKSWLSVKVDGKTVFHGALATGRSETWRVKEKVELSLGDAGAVELQVNDQRFTNLGRRGKPLKNVVINKEGLKISR